MGLADAQLRGVFHRNDAFVIGNVRGERIEQGGLPGARIARDQDVFSRANRLRQLRRLRVGDGSRGDQV